MSTTLLWVVHEGRTDAEQLIQRRTLQVAKMLANTIQSPKEAPATGRWDWTEQEVILQRLTSNSSFALRTQSRLGLSGIP